MSDQWVEPFVIVGNDDKPVGPIEDGDSVIIFNFRAGEFFLLICSCCVSDCMCVQHVALCTYIASSC